jgi:hypothetical protein
LGGLINDMGLGTAPPLVDTVQLWSSLTEYDSVANEPAFRTHDTQW